MSVPEAANMRFNTCAGGIRSQEIADILRHEVYVTSLQGRVPTGSPGKAYKAGRCGSARHQQGIKDPWYAVTSKVVTFSGMGRQFAVTEKRIA
jgi:hypothetical protein